MPLWKQSVLPTSISNGSFCWPHKAPLRSGGSWRLRPRLRRWHGAPRGGGSPPWRPAPLDNALPSLPACPTHGVRRLRALRGRLCAYRRASARSLTAAMAPHRPERILRNLAAEPRCSAADSISQTSAFNPCKGRKLSWLFQAEE